MLHRFWEIVKRHPYLIGGSILFLVVLIWVSGRSKPAAQAPAYQAPDNSAAIQANAQLTGLQAQLSAASAHDQVQLEALKEQLGTQTTLASMNNAAQLDALDQTNAAQYALATLVGQVQTNNNQIAADVTNLQTTTYGSLQSLVANLNAQTTQQANQLNAGVSTKALDVQALIAQIQAQINANNNQTKVDLANVDLNKTQTTGSQLVQTITALYNNVLGRAPDTAGLLYWSDQATQGKLSTAQLTAAFQNSVEHSTYSSTNYATATGNTPTSTPTAGGGVLGAITAEYTNVLGRAPDPAGLSYWTNAVTTGQLSLSQVHDTFAATAADGLIH